MDHGKHKRTVYNYATGKHEKFNPAQSPGMSAVFRDVLRAVGFEPIVDRKKNIAKETKKAE